MPFYVLVTEKNTIFAHQRRKRRDFLKRRNLLHTHYIHTPVFSRQLATLTSPAKGVGWGDWREGSNPSFSAIYVHNSDVVHVVFLEENIAVNVIAFQSIIKGKEI